jgi:hypothetical protein
MPRHARLIMIWGDITFKDHIYRNIMHRVLLAFVEIRE